MFRSKLSFFSGVLATILVIAMVTTALAVSGAISYNGVNISVMGEPAVAAGEAYTAENGQKVPSSIRYTDETGGATNYLSVRQIAELLDADLYWDGASKTVRLGELPDGDYGDTIISGDVVIGIENPENAKTTVGPFTEIAAKLPGADAQAAQRMPETRITCADSYGFGQTFRCNPETGKYVSITITNHSTADIPLQFELGRQKTIGLSEGLATVDVEAGQTVTRTVQIAEGQNPLTYDLYVRVIASALEGKPDFSISVVQFQ